jgi:hypothetical protein
MFLLFLFKIIKIEKEGTGGRRRPPASENLAVGKSGTSGTAEHPLI